MTRIFAGRRRRLTATVAAVAILLTVAFALVKPHVTRAFTPDHPIPAVLFGPVFVDQASTVQLCTINWGDSMVLVVMGIVPLSNTNNVLARMERSLAPGAGMCLPYTPGPNGVSQNLTGIMISGNAVTGNQGNPGNSGGNLGGGIFGSSMQVSSPACPCAPCTQGAQGGGLAVTGPQFLVSAQIPPNLIHGGS